METIDFIYLIPIALAGVYGFYKGFITEAFKFLAYIIAIICCLKFTSMVVNGLQTLFHNNKWIPFIGFILTAGITFFVVILFGNKIKGALKILKLGLIDQMAGGLFGIAQASFFASLTIWFLDNVHLISSQTKTNSISYKTLRTFAPYIIEKVTKVIPTCESLIKDINQTFNI